MWGLGIWRPICRQYTTSMQMCAIFTHILVGSLLGKIVGPESCPTRGQGFLVGALKTIITYDRCLVLTLVLTYGTRIFFAPLDVPLAALLAIAADQDLPLVVPFLVAFSHLPLQLLE